MTEAASQLVVLLPERRRFSGQPLTPAIAKVLGRADRNDRAEPGERAQLLRYFELLPRGWPMAAITREADAGDAALHAWLRADPVFLRPDMNGVRLIAWGNIGLTAAESEEFLRPLRPLFGDVGFPISATAPERWYLALPRESKIPAFTPPVEGLGEDLLSHLPQGPEAQRWRSLMNESQVILHNHPRNAQRVAAGLLPVNSLWFWGGGVLPDSVSCMVESVTSVDNELLALAKRAGAALSPQETGSALIDLRGARDWHKMELRHLESALATLKRRHRSLLLDFADGVIFRIESGQRWRWWRRPLSGIDA